MDVSPYFVRVAIQRVLLLSLVIAIAATVMFASVQERREPVSVTTLHVTDFPFAWYLKTMQAKIAERRGGRSRGQMLFNERALGPRRATCSGCHNAPNVGSSSTGAFYEGVAGEPDPALALYTLRCLRGPMAGRTLRTTDPGWGLVTGRCIDVGRFKVPTLRGLAGRAPYFHNGSAATLDDVVDSYDRRFEVGLTPAEKHDLVAFLRAL